MTTKKTKRIIKKYANRKMYDTEGHCYITLTEFLELNKDTSEETVVIDQKTREDITHIVFVQAITQKMQNSASKENVDKLRKFANSL